MNPKREQTQKKILEFIKDIDPSGLNLAPWEYRFSKMTDKEFDDWMKAMYEDPEQTHLSIDLDQTSGKTDKSINIDHIEKVAKKYNVKLREYIAFPHLNPDDPSNPVVTSTPVPVLAMYVRKMQQFLQHKNFNAGTIDHMNPLTGQVTGDSKAASIGDMQTSALVTTNQKDTIKEMLTIRSDNLPGKLRMLKMIEENGSVSYDDCNVNLADSQSLQTLRVFIRGACLDSKVLSAKDKDSKPVVKK